MSHFISLTVQLLDVNGPVYTEPVDHILYLQRHKKTSYYECV